MTFEFEAGEKVVREVHRHWFVMLRSGFFLAVSAVLPFFILAATGLVSGVSADAVGKGAPIAIFLYSLWLLGIWTFAFIEWTDYYLDLWYVTDRRIINVNQRGFFHREVISFHFDTVQNISFDTKGVIATLFKFGDVQVQTAGTNEKIVLRDTANAADVKHLILEYRERARTAPREVTIAPGASGADAPSSDPY